jgi:hypothetical protein
LNKRTSSYLTFLGLKECQHRLIPEKGGGIPFLLFCDNDQYEKIYILLYALFYG